MNRYQIAAARAACAASLLIVTAACNRSNKNEEHAAGEVDRSWTPQSLTTIKGVPANAVRDAIEQRLGSMRPTQLGEDSWRHARALYQQYARGPLWLDEDGLDASRTRDLANALASADSDAIDLRAYPVAELARALDAVKQTERPTAEQLADADVLLTVSYAALGEDLLTGQIDPRKLSQDWHIDAQEEHVDSALVLSLREARLEQAITRMRPQDDDYGALRRELLQYRALVSRGGWGTVPAGKALKPGDTDKPARIAALQNRLRAEGLFGDATAPASASPNNGTPADSGAPYDPQLAGAVAQYQARHGIDVDSILGPGTVASMNLSAEYRLGQIAGNLERYRWLPRALGSRYVLVNVPAFRLEAYDGGKKALEMKVIVGAEYNNRTTPVFSDSMQYVVFRPYWIPTDSIVANEIAPKAAKDPGYLAHENMEYATIDGKRRVRQKPGPKNSLGLVKFMFPNEFSIYLHDTPEGELFEKDVRAFSHGCIRLEHPDQLASFVLGWPADKVKQAMQQSPDNRDVRLPSKIPVYILYFTTYVQNGQLHFGNDLYKRDDALVKAMAPAATAAADVSREVDALKRAAGA